MSQEVFGNTNFGFNMYNTGNHNQMQQLNQVTNNYMFNKNNARNKVSKSTSLTDVIGHIRFIIRNEFYRIVIDTKINTLTDSFPTILLWIEF